MSQSSAHFEHYNCKQGIEQNISSDSDPSINQIRLRLILLDLAFYMYIGYVKKDKDNTFLSGFYKGEGVFGTQPEKGFLNPAMNRVTYIYLFQSL